jgi:CRISPR system Cascade subunit CasA
VNQNTSFNLVDEPWVRIRDEGGRAHEVSLLELFEQAPHIKCLANDLPTQDFAILRVLLAILQRAILPAVEEDDDPAEVWGDLWNADELPISDIRAYLDEWRYRFDLFDKERPFMQVAGLRTEKDEISSIKKIVADVPDGDVLFSLRSGKGAESLSYSEAARWLIHAQAFDTSGIKSGTVGDLRVKRGKSYPIGTGWAGGIGGLFFEGSTLFETLLLNFIVRDSDDGMFSADDIPSWERPAEVAGSDERFPTGKLDLYTWQSRRIRLIPKDDRVVGVVLTNGDKLESRNLYRYEPMTAWRRSLTQEKKLKQSPVYLPLTHQPGRALWRGLDSIFGKNTEEDIPSIIKPELEDWISYLASREGGQQLNQRYLLKAHAVGFEYGTQSSVITNLIDDKVELSAFLLSHEGESLVTLAKDCAASTSDAINALGIFAGNLIKATGSSDDNQIRGAKQDSQAQAFFEVDSPFRLWLAGLDESSDAKTERAQWRQSARQIISRRAYQLLRESSSDAIVGSPIRDKKEKIKEWMTASLADARFNAALKKALPLEEDIKETKEEEVH